MPLAKVSLVLSVAFVQLFKCFIQYYPDDDRLGSKRFAVQSAESEAVFTVCTC
jgi:hypothetical protein